MKVYLRDLDNFSNEAISFYRKHFEITKEELNSDYIVINNFDTIETDKPVACNTTGIEHIKSPEIISLRGEDLSELTAVAELCIGMMILLTRGKHEEIKGKTLGIIGLGRIGKQLAYMAYNMGMEVLWYDKASANSMSLDKVLHNSDIISLQITSDPENKNFFNKKMFEKMKNGSIFLNSSRPWLVDMKGLKWALNKKLSYAWYDFDMSFEHDRLITTPHMGGTTRESHEKSELIIANKLLHYDSN
jgi:phosphoglycerate dehydrogenase-like enzyme